MNGLERLRGWGPRLPGWLGALVVCGVGALAWSGYRAAMEWQSSSALVAEQRAHDLVTLLTTAFTRDMRGVQETVLARAELVAHSFDSPSEVTDAVATAFARYPYPEAFFGWNGSSQAAALFFTRADRPSPWVRTLDSGGHYPVMFGTNDTLERELRRRIRRDAAAQRQYAAFDLSVDGAPYQVIARLVYSDGTRQDLTSVFGFLVNLRGVHDDYFPRLAQQVSRIAEASSGLEYAIADDRGTVIAGPAALSNQEGALTRTFLPVFIDPAHILLDPPPDLASAPWTIRVTGARDHTLELAARGAQRTMLAISAAALIAGFGLVVAVRAAQASARVAEMRSDFVSAVTHELKTPLSTIRTIAETLVRGRLSTVEQVRTYAELLAQEERRLARLIDNLLAYARVTDVTEVYSFESLSPHVIAEEALARFTHPQLQGAFDLQLRVDPLLPCIRADRTALVLALDNLIDNAIRYSGESRTIVLSGRMHGARVEFAVTDAGVGIPLDDLESVQKRFTRGRTAIGQGSGLGLAIVRRIADDHGGELRLESAMGRGTTVRLAIPVAA